MSGEAGNAQVRLMQAARYAIERGGTKRDVRDLVESALAEYDDFGQSINHGPMFPQDTSDGVAVREGAAA